MLSPYSLQIKTLHLHYVVLCHFKHGKVLFLENQGNHKSNHYYNMSNFDCIDPFYCRTDILKHSFFHTQLLKGTNLMLI